jgi:hypothetical protein
MPSRSALNSQVFRCIHAPLNVSRGLPTEKLPVRVVQDRSDATSFCGCLQGLMHSESSASSSLLCACRHPCSRTWVGSFDNYLCRLCDCDARVLTRTAAACTFAIPRAEDMQTHGPAAFRTSLAHAALAFRDVCRAPSFGCYAALRELQAESHSRITNLRSELARHKVRTACKQRTSLLCIARTLHGA